MSEIVRQADALHRIIFWKLFQKFHYVSNILASIGRD